MAVERSENLKYRQLAMYYFKYGSQVRAIQKVYGIKDYDKACWMGSEYFRKPQVREELKKICDEIRAETDPLQGAIIEELKAIGFAKMKDYVRIIDGNLELIDTEMLPENGDAAIQHYSETITAAGGTKSIKLHDKVKALEKILQIIADFEKKASRYDETKIREKDAEKNLKISPDEYLLTLKLLKEAKKSAG